MSLKESIDAALAVELEEARPPEFSDDALALVFADCHADDLRYVAARNKWLRWDSARWQKDETLLAFDLARPICREAAKRLDNKPRQAKTVTSAKTIAAVATLARADRRLAATVDQWDADTWKMNTTTGTIDLKTGDLRAHRREDYITKITVVAPGGDCPLWRSFLERITGGDADLGRFLQRMAGYALTGSTQAHALFFLYGTGSNGKTVFLEIHEPVCDFL